MSPEPMGSSSARLGLLHSATGDPVAQAAVVQLPNAGPGPKGLRQDVRVLSTCPASPGAQHSAALESWPGLWVVSQPRPAFIYAAGHSPFRTLSVRDQEASRYQGNKQVPAAAFSRMPWLGGDMAAASSSP